MNTQTLTHDTRPDMHAIASLFDNLATVALDSNSSDVCTLLYGR